MEEDILEQVRIVGKAIAECETMKKVQAAELAQMNDIEAQALIADYQKNHEKWINEAKEGGLTKEKMEVARAKIDAEYDKVASYPVIAEYLAAKKEMDNLTSDVNNILNFYMTGKDVQGGCSGGCSSCGGCH